MEHGLSEDRLAEKLLHLALKKGAEAAEVLQSKSISRPVFFEANRLKQLDSSSSLGTALRLWVNGRPGLAVAYGNVDPESIVKKALDISVLNEPEPIAMAKGQVQHYPDMGNEVTAADLIEGGQQIIENIRSAYPEVLCDVEMECDVEKTRILNSKGLDRSYIDTTLSSYLNAEWIRGDDFLSVGDGQTCRDSFDANALVEQVLLRLVWAKRNAVTTSGRLPVLFTAKAADMLWGTLQMAISGKRVLDQSSPWNHALGEQVCSPTLTLSQNPEVGPFSCPFDDEGVDTQQLTFIEDGILRLFYCDLTVGRKLGGSSTGNGFRPGLGSYPTPGLYNTIINPGQTSFNNLVASIERGILVDQVLGGGAGISGDFSVNIDLGYYIQRGEIVGRIKDTMVSGNVYTALSGSIELGSDVNWHGSCYTPSVLIDDLSITGN
jgi:PmbA protein